MGDRTRLILILMLTLIAISIANGAKLSREVPASEVLAKIKAGQSAEFDNCTIVGNLNLSALKIDEPVHFNNTLFQNSANFEGTIFNRTAYFIGATFEGLEKPWTPSPAFYMEFAYLTKKRGFSKSSFSENVWSRGEAVFCGATFSEDAWFNGATFGRDAVFSGATFGRDAVFSGATFSRNVYFSGVTFNGDAVFSRFDYFSGATLSREAWFGGGAYFSGATFGGDAYLRGVTFSGEARFSGVTFSGNAVFSDATFSVYAYFNGATFSEDAWFNRATFSEDAWFGGDLYFRGATFSGETYFGDATFSGDAVFRGATFSGFFLGWDDIKESIKSDEATYLGLVENFKNQGQFYEADDGWFQYRSQYMKTPSDYLALVTCGFGVKWLQTIYFGIFMILSFGLLYYRIITTRSNFSETAAAYPRSKLRSIMFKNKEIFTGQLLDSIWFSTVVLLSVPSELYPNKADTYKKYAKEIKYHWPILERLIGLGIWLLFINTLSRTILHL